MKKSRKTFRTAVITVVIGVLVLGSLLLAFIAFISAGEKDHPGYPTRARDVAPVVQDSTRLLPQEIGESVEEAALEPVEEVSSL